MPLGRRPTTGIRRPRTSGNRRTSPSMPPSRRRRASKALAAWSLLGDSVTTDHISPAGIDQARRPGRQYLLDHGVERGAFNCYGSRRGNHEVMVRGTFANVRLKNLLVDGQRRRPGRPSAWGRGDVDLRRRGAIPRGGSAARRHRRQGIRLRVVARLGREGAGAARSSRRHRRELRADPSLATC